jgi:undecaprenyl-diphosphatase
MRILLLCWAFVAFAGCCFLYGSYTDMALVRAINTGHNKVWDGAFTAITDSAAIISFGIAGLCLLLYLVKKNGRWLFRGMVLLSSLLLTTLAVQLLKHFIARPRPCDVYSFIEKLSDAGGGSFPSGHTADAFTLIAFFTLMRFNKLVIISIYAWGGLVAYSRVYLGVHYASDVLGAMPLGILACSCLFFLFIQKKIEEKYFAGPKNPV